MIQGLLAQDRRCLSKVITLFESTRADHRQRADAVLNALMPHTGRALRLGISGVPGVGKSTFIEALGLFLLRQGHALAVLAIDPSSTLSGGSILGDKTRMNALSAQANAYIRPSPAAGTLGGVAQKTREAILACEAAGFDVVIVETVGVGQSETAVADLVDVFALLQLPNAGDDLQAIKKGVMELADVVVINKADLDGDAARRAQSQIVSALKATDSTGGVPAWMPQVVLASARQAEGVESFWECVQRCRQLREASGELADRRRRQSIAWMWEWVNSALLQEFRQRPAVRTALAQVLQDVREGKLAPSAAARYLLRLSGSAAAG